MTKSFTAVRVAVVALSTATCMAPVASHGQSSPASTHPRTHDGKPDFSGYWRVMNSAWLDIQDHSAAKGVPAGQGVVIGNEIPYLPSALVRKKENYERRETADPVSTCYAAGVPRITYMPYPFQIFQTPRTIGFLYEYMHSVREVHLNSDHLEGPLEWWMGDSRGRWEGDTLVVDVVHFNDATWFDHSGNHHSDALHVVERYTFLDADHLNYQVTIEDPKVFSRPWEMRMILYRHKEPDFQLLEYECHALQQTH